MIKIVESKDLIIEVRIDLADTASVCLECAGHGTLIEWQYYGPAMAIGNRFTCPICGGRGVIFAKNPPNHPVEPTGVPSKTNEAQ